MMDRQEIELGGALSTPEWEKIMRACPISLVTLKKGAENLLMPSKTYSALVAGQAILAICARDSDLGELVVKYDCGWVVPPGDIEGLAACLEGIKRDQSMLLRKRRRAYEVGHKLFESTVVAGEWNRLLSDLISKGSPNAANRTRGA
jgi:colanic acid biosynthesis glycosyl transferase WcaI